MAAYWAIAVRSFRRYSMTWWLAADLGRALFQLVGRGVVPLGVGAMIFDLRFPASPQVWPAIALSLLLALLVSFGIRYLVDLSAFWILDSRGLESLMLVLALFFSGMILPLVVFPGWIGEVARATPWAAVLLVAGQLLTRLATRKVVIHGG